MKISSKYLAPFTTFFLILLWVYAAVSKLMDFEKFQAQMSNQTLSPELVWLATYLLPPAELSVAGLLCFERTLMKGLYASALLLSAFSVYIALALLKVFGRVPCSCGGILEKLRWGPHLVFNLTFLALTLITITILKRKEVVTYIK